MDSVPDEKISFKVQTNVRRLREAAVIWYTLLAVCTGGDGEEYI